MKHRTFGNVAFLDKPGELEQLQRIGKAKLYKNTLLFNDTAYQISNICSVWVADHSYRIHHKLPIWIPIVGFLGSAYFLMGAVKGQYLAAVPGVAAIAMTIWGYRRFVPQTAIAKFALGIELASGRRSLLVASDKSFVVRAAHAIAIAIANQGEMDDKTTVMNFDNRTINIESAVGSNIIGGDVVGSLVETI